jgi:hypothetical protein
MKRLMKVLLGLSIGAAIAMLFAPKRGRELRERLIGGATGKLLPAAPVEFPEPEGERSWEAGATTAVAEPPVVEAVAVETAAEAVEEEVEAPEGVEAPEEVAVIEPEVVGEVVAAEPGIAEEATSEDLRARIAETRAAVETDIAQPFAVAVSDVVVGETVAEEAVVEEAVVEEAAPEEADQVVVEEPVLEGPEFHEPFALPEPEAVVEAPPEEPQIEAPVAEAPVAEPPVLEESIAEEASPSAIADGLAPDITSSPVALVAEEAPAVVVAVEEVRAEELLAEEPVAEEPAAEEEPAARDGGTINQAEMRRRIEETRARLKAKAFDAMMSGESALLARDSGEKPVPKGDDVKLDGELESTIDESLSQEEY